MKVIRLVFFAVLAFFSASGCTGGLPMTEEDAKRDWNEFEELLMVRSIEDDVSNESSGNRPPGGAESWNEYWLVRIEYLSKDLEKNQVYIDYIKTQRQEAGLPPLEGR